MANKKKNNTPDHRKKTNFNFSYPIEFLKTRIFTKENKENVAEFIKECGFEVKIDNKFIGTLNDCLMSMNTLDINFTKENIQSAFKNERTVLSVDSDLDKFANELNNYVKNQVSYEVFTPENIENLIGEYGLKDITPHQLANTLNDHIIDSAILWHKEEVSKPVPKNIKSVINNIKSKSAGLLEEIKTLENYGYQDAINLFQYKYEEGYSCVLMLNQTPTELEEILPDTIALLQKDETLTAYWLNPIKQCSEIKSFNIDDPTIQPLLQDLPKPNEISQDKKLIDKIVRIYECAQVEYFNSNIYQLIKKSKKLLKDFETRAKIADQRISQLPKQTGKNKSIDSLDRIIANLIQVYEHHSGKEATSYYKHQKNDYDTPFIKFSVDCCKIIKLNHTTSFLISSQISNSAIGERAKKLISIKRRNKKTHEKSLSKS